MQGTKIGVGPALRKARLLRGVTLREASRDTRIRPEFLEALEKERFEKLLGDVYVRGALRSYSSYLGLNSDRVVAAYARVRRDGDAPPPLPSEVGEGLRRRRRDDHRLILLTAGTVLAIAAAFGVLSKSNSAPEPADIPASPVPLQAPDRGITVSLVAHREVEVTVIEDDGPPQTYLLHPQEARSFEADVSLTIRASDGGAVQLSVNGADKGAPGKPGSPWQRTFSYGTREAAPSPPAG